MSADGKPIDMPQGMDMSGLLMAGMPGMAMPTVNAESVAARVPQVAKFVRYSGWPELREALVAGKVRMAMMLGPVPVKVVALGHRSGAVIMVRTESPYRTFADLKGKRSAIPSRFAVDHIFVRKLIAAHGLKDGDLTMLELAPARHARGTAGERGGRLRYARCGRRNPYSRILRYKVLDEIPRAVAARP